MDNNNTLMASNPNHTQDPLAQLRAAWYVSDQDLSETGGLRGFFLQVQTILDDSRITREWNDCDLPKYRSSPYEERGPLKLIRPWRTAFFRLALGGLLANSIARGWAPLGRQFWLTTFPNRWCEGTLGNDRASPPPMAPSLVLPATEPFARTEDYRRWAKDEIPRRISKLGATRLADLIARPYDPTDPEAFSLYAQAVSAASVILMADKLGLGEEYAGLDPDTLILEWLDSAVNEPFQYRYRGDGQLWPPDQKRVYVDLKLRPILGQVLNYLEGDWNRPWVTRSLSLWEASTRTVGDSVVHTRLRRIDLELAVWCETMLRLIPEAQPVRGRADAGAVRPVVQGEGSSNGLPRRMQELARRIHEATSTLSQGPASAPRFLAPASWSLLEKQAAIESSPLSLTDGIALIPPSFAKPTLDFDDPVLEGDILSLNLDWEWVAPDASWMDIRLLVLTRVGNQDTYASIDYEEIEEEHEAPLCLRLKGETWEMLSRTHGSEKLIPAFEEAWFARRTSGLGTGAMVLGLIDLTEVG
ncbi:MAG: hypothetical protein NT159_19320 [Proteobacteria bacterium]|nr:hypothetical protein [Pseudomonadota bacterium]